MPGVAATIRRAAEHSTLQVRDLAVSLDHQESPLGTVAPTACLCDGSTNAIKVTARLLTSMVC